MNNGRAALARRGSLLRTAAWYLGVSAFCVLFDKIYALYGHGVRSAAMSLMFLYPLAGGALPFFLLWGFAPEAVRARRYRLMANCYNSGIATLTVGSAVRGILEIAGTSSPYQAVFTVVGWGFVLAGLALLAAVLAGVSSARGAD